MKGCDKQKSHKEEKENTAEINYKVPKTLVCNANPIKVVSVVRDLELSALKFTILNALRSLMTMSLESIRSSRIEEKPPNSIKKMRNSSEIKFNGATKKLRSLIKGQWKIIGKREWFNAIIVSGNSLMNNYLNTRRIVL